MKTALWMIFALFCPTCAAVQEICACELVVITRAAIRNKCTSKEDFRILLAIRKAENGGPGKEFGVKGMAWGTNLDIQAGWCAATIVKNRKRWLRAGRPLDFITFLALRYCPPSDDFKGHQNWVKNVKYFCRSKGLGRSILKDVRGPRRARPAPESNL